MAYIILLIAAIPVCQCIYEDCTCNLCQLKDEADHVE